MWLPDIVAEGGPKYLAVAAVLSRDISSGRLRPGDRLPPQRVLADQLRIDLTTVTKAYNEVRRHGLIEGGGRRGSFVTDRVGAVSMPEDQPVDTGMNLPPEPVGGTFADRFCSGVSDLLLASGGGAALRYQPVGGAIADRAAGAALLRSRGIKAPDDTVIVAGGGQNALHAAVSAAFVTGDAIGTAAHVYPGFLSVARRYGLEIEAIASDTEGILPDALEVACRTRGLQGLYLVPTNDNPTTATMGRERRQAIVECAERHDLTIIEDDAYGLLPGRPLPPLAALAPDRTWHILSLSKVISPGLRVAYLRVPSIKIALRTAIDIHETIVMAPPLNAALATKWLGDGSLGALISEIRIESIFRQQMVAKILDAGYASHPEGYHIWLSVPADGSPIEIVNALRPMGLSIMPSESFAVDRNDRTQALRVSIGGALSRERLERTLHMLAAMLATRQNRRAPTV